MLPGLVLTLAGCPSDDDSQESGSDTDNGSGTDSAGSGDLPEGCDFLVEEGESAQEDIITAFVEVQTGQTVCVAAGNYAFTRQLTLNANGVTVRGDGPESTIFDFSDQASGGNGILVEGDDVVLEGFAVKNTPGDGIRSNAVDGAVYRNVHVGWDAQHSQENGAYALYPVQSSNVHIDGCVTYNARDAGVYIGQSNNVLIENSEAYDNVIGIEVENTTDAIVRNNTVHDNTLGILVITLPQLDILDGKRANVYGNTVEANNVPNFGDPGTIVGTVPPGIGIAVVAADTNEIWDNTVRDNDSGGIAVIQYITDLFGDYDDPEFDPFSEGNYVHDNVLENNGTNPDSTVLLLNGMANPGPQMVTDGCTDPNKDTSDPALANCILPGDASFWNADFCNNQMDATDDPAAFDCTQPALPTDSPVQE